LVGGAVLLVDDVVVEVVLRVAGGAWKEQGGRADCGACSRVGHAVLSEAVERLLVAVDQSTAGQVSRC
jgi:hypothetical protein